MFDDIRVMHDWMKKRKESGMSDKEMDSNTGLLGLVGMTLTSLLNEIRSLHEKRAKESERIQFNLRQRLSKLESENKQLIEGIKSIRNLINKSDGIKDCGFHGGKNVTWHNILGDGWVKDFCIAEDMIKENESV